jgi:hypothetical protein
MLCHTCGKARGCTVVSTEGIVIPMPHPINIRLINLKQWQRLLTITLSIDADNQDALGDILYCANCWDARYMCAIVDLCRESEADKINCVTVNHQTVTNDTIVYQMCNHIGLIDLKFFDDLHNVLWCIQDKDLKKPDIEVRYLVSPSMLHAIKQHLHPNVR